jgi:HK97 family phage prohead protease
MAPAHRPLQPDKGDNAMALKKRFGYAKSIDQEKRQITAYVSTYEWDRTDERFAQGAWKLDDYLKNPVMLWAHDYKKPPIGKALSIAQDDQGLLAVAQFADDEFSTQIFDLFRGGYLSAFSVGFNPKNYKVEPIDATRKGIVFTEADLLEFSVVPVPANPGAVVSRDVAELVLKTIGEKGILRVGEGADTKFVIPPDGPEQEPEFKPDLERSLKGIIELAKTVRGQKLEKQKVDLLLTAMEVFKEIVDQNREGVSPENIKELQAHIKALGDVIKDMRPDAEETVKQVMRQLERALSAGRAA